MAIDSTLFIGKIPAGTYAVGDTVPLQVHSGPAVVRQGYGTPVLKDVVTGLIVTGGGTTVVGDVVIQNANWIDSMRNKPAALNDVLALSDSAASVQSGNDVQLEPNSGWTVYFEVEQAITSTADNSVFCLIDIEYPAVSAVVNPDKETGFPVSIKNVETIPVYDAGNAPIALWSVFNVDDFKAGSRYLLQKMSVTRQDSTGLLTGFVAFANAAGMGGLCRIVPYCSGNNTACKKIKYASPLTKGPMDLRILAFNVGGAASTDLAVICDYVKRSA